MTLIRTSRRMYPSVFNHLFNTELAGWRNAGFSTDDATVPAVNLLENDNFVQIELAAPGMKREDFKIELDQNLLTVSAELEEENAETRERYSRKEFSYKSFSRVFNVPAEILDGDQIQAVYKDGILLLTLPKREESKPKPSRLIEIQ